MRFFSGRLGLQQRILPAYRAPFFEALAQACTDGLEIIAGQPRSNEAMGPAARLEKAHLQMTYNRYLFQGGLTLVWQSGLRQWLQHVQPEALIAEANPRNLSNASAVRWMHERRRPVLGWGLGAPAFHGIFTRWREERRRAYLAQFDALITYSHQGAAEFIQVGYPQEQVYVAPNAVESRPLMSPVRSDKFDGHPVVLYVGRLQPRKRVNLLLQACSSLPESLHPRLWIVGDGPERTRLENLARQIYPAAQFLGDLRGQALDERYNQADLFVLPGTGGLAIQQAMAHGLPVIVAEADGTQTDLVRPENGWCLPKPEPAVLVTVLESALAAPGQLRQMGNESYRIVAEEINLETMVNVFVQAINQTFERVAAGTRVR